MYPCLNARKRFGNWISENVEQIQSKKLKKEGRDKWLEFTGKVCFFFLFRWYFVRS
jgi:hypothetical protein